MGKPGFSARACGRICSSSCWLCHAKLVMHATARLWGLFPRAGSRALRARPSCSPERLVSSVVCVSGHCAGSDDCTWHMYRLPSSELVVSGEGHSGWLSAIAFHPQARPQAAAHLQASTRSCMDLWRWFRRASVRAGNSSQACSSADGVAAGGGAGVGRWRRGREAVELQQAALRGDTAW